MTNPHERNFDTLMACASASRRARTLIQATPTHLEPPPPDGVVSSYDGTYEVPTADDLLRRAGDLATSSGMPQSHALEVLYVEMADHLNRSRERLRSVVTQARLRLMTEDE